jgi:hypothetical protein
MNNSKFFIIAFEVAFTLGSKSMIEADEAQRYVQDSFAIGFWGDPSADENLEQNYADIDAANFTLVVGGFGANIPETVQKQRMRCEKYGLKAIIWSAGFTPM